MRGGGGVLGRISGREILAALPFAYKTRRSDGIRTRIHSIQSRSNPTDCYPIFTRMIALVIKPALIFLIEERVRECRFLIRHNWSLITDSNCVKFLMREFIYRSNSFSCYLYKIIANGRKGARECTGPKAKIKRDTISLSGNIGCRTLIRTENSPFGREKNRSSSNNCYPKA